MKKTKIFTALALTGLCLGGGVLLSGCEPNKDTNNYTTYTVTFDYSTALGATNSYFDNSKTTITVRSDKWLTDIPTVKDEYENWFLGWYIKGTSKQIYEYDFVGGDITLETKWDTTMIKEVKSNSQYPILEIGDMVGIIEENEYSVGDIICYRVATIDVFHRIIAIYTDTTTGKVYYLCHGDNVQSAISVADYETIYGVDSYPENEIVAWDVDKTYVQSLIAANKTLSEILTTARNLQAVEIDQIIGKVGIVL